MVLLIQFNSVPLIFSSYTAVVLARIGGHKSGAIGAVYVARLLLAEIAAEMREGVWRRCYLDYRQTHNHNSEKERKKNLQKIIN